MHVYDVIIYEFWVTEGYLMYNAVHFYVRGDSTYYLLERNNRGDNTHAQSNYY